MKQLLIAPVALLVSVCIISGAALAGSLQPFVIDEHYLGAGGKPLALSEFAANPRAYLRSAAAYESLKGGFADQLGRELSDAEFSALLSSDQVRLVPCVGRIYTAGISQSGSIGWFTRACYLDEQLIELNVNGIWEVVASQGCFNLVRPKPTPAPGPALTPIPRPVTKPAPPLRVTTSPLLHSSPKLFVQETYGAQVDTYCDWFYLPGYRGTLLQNR